MFSWEISKYRQINKQYYIDKTPPNDLEMALSSVVITITKSSKMLVLRLVILPKFLPEKS